ncbi:hypothetical protein J7E70_30675 [Variovorax paradoxus]|nr:hypothetical protein [Variovorax paradoxus]MBT2304786.1 hypothetical protein [Variovorax paradoxus]
MALRHQEHLLAHRDAALVVVGALGEASAADPAQQESSGFFAQRRVGPGRVLEPGEFAQGVGEAHAEAREAFAKRLVALCVVGCGERTLHQGEMMFRIRLAHLSCFFASHWWTIRRMQ